MRKIIVTSAIFALLAGCSGGFLGMRGNGDGGNTGIRNTHGAGSTDRYYTGAVQTYGEKYWPPVVQGQAFPPQEMWSD
jgi:hypothetical protein